MSATYRNVEVETLIDKDPDWSYLEQPEFEDRLAARNRGEFCHLGIRAKCEVLLPMGGDIFTTFTLASPGLWGIESDSDESHLTQIKADEKQTLLTMLAELGAVAE